MAIGYIPTPQRWVERRNRLGRLLEFVNEVMTRTFTYDSLSRLLTSSNPETGQITYTYDANGNVLTKTDARNITSNYAVDALNRVTRITYSNGDPSLTFTYDQTYPSPKLDRV